MTLNMLIAYNPMLRLHLFLKVCFYVHHKVIWIDQSQTLSFVNTCAFTYAHKHGPHVSWKQEVRKSTHHSMFCEATPCSGSSHAQQNVSLENDECQEIETMGKERRSNDFNSFLKRSNSWHHEECSEEFALTLPGNRSPIYWALSQAANGLNEDKHQYKGLSPENSLAVLDVNLRCNHYM